MRRPPPPRSTSVSVSYRKKRHAGSGSSDGARRPTSPPTARIPAELPARGLQAPDRQAQTGGDDRPGGSSVTQTAQVPYTGSRLIHDADAHIVEPPGWL